jgi:hypothetical protein
MPALRRTPGHTTRAGASKLNTGLIAAKGVGDNSYSLEIGRGAVKGNLSDGTFLRTAVHRITH